MIKHLPENFLKQILIMFNKSFNEISLCSKWKISKITMINKKDSNKQDPNNYRPISVSSCLGKILERIMNNRLYKICEENGLLTYQQSGFRKSRGVKDNLTFLTQKIAETFIRKKKMCCLFFDISKAFDKVWHNGLIFKMIQNKCPLYIVKWIKDFLTNRKFIINVNGTFSESADILCSVPQGSAISALLFNIYINDIPKRDIANGSGSLLYCDDLGTFFMYKKNGNIENIINKYLKEIEIWLSKWKMKMSATKCSYIIFHNGPTRPKLLDLKIFNSNIPFEEKPTFLGVTFDERLNFNCYIDKTTIKANDRLKIIRILSNKFYKINSKTLFAIYKSLVGSIIDYSSFCITQLSRSNIQKIQTIQNSATRSILSLDYYTNSDILFTIASSYAVYPFETRANFLNKKYFERNITTNNHLIIKLIKEFINGFQARHFNIETVLCPYNDLYSLLNDYLI